MAPRRRSAPSNLWTPTALACIGLVISLTVNFAFVSTWVNTRREINDSVAQLDTISKVLMKSQKGSNDSSLIDATFKMVQTMHGNIDTLDRNYAELKGSQTWLIDAVKALDKKVGEETPPPMTKRRR